MANTKTPAADTNSKVGTSFVLDDVAMETLKSTRGRKEEESPYKAEVADARTTGDTKGIALTATLKAPWVMAQLRKAAKQNGYPTDITVYDRSDTKTLSPELVKRFPHGFVAYKVRNGSEATVEATN